MLCLILLIFIIGSTQGLELKTCEQIEKENGTIFRQICNNGKPRGNWTVDSSVGILDITEVNEEKRYLGIQLQIMLYWPVNHLSVVGPNISDVFEIPEAHYDNLKIPKLMFIRSKNTEIVPLFGDNKNSVSFFGLKNFGNGTMEMYYSQSVKIDLGCSFKFGHFPFDKGHVCKLKYFTPPYTIKDLVLKPPTIFDTVKTV